jgi:hypothetical protein
MILSSKLYWLIIIRVKVYAISCVSLPSLYGTKYLYLVSRSVMTSIESYTVFVIGSLDFSSLMIKSSAIDLYAHSLVGGDWSSLYSMCRFDLLLLHKSHSATVFSTTFLIPGK